MIFGVNAGRLHPESNTATVYLELLGDTPSDYVRFDTTYQVRIDTIAEDMEGERMERPYTFSFRTGKPQVIGSRPADGERFALLSPQDPLVFMLNDQLDQRSLSERDIVIQPRLETNPRIEAYSDPQSGWTSIYVSGVWKPDTEYRVTLGKAIANVDGVSFGNTPFEVRFRTSPQRPLAPSTLDGQQRIRSGR
ncbi:MAG: hypothetical protein BWZ10_00896 [candidate division BRC1 bacterium ADurb.BinA364]|nr:MAG: hypothetical protein BWZ10_00896 [candidate division BRC1 bacterium ADurb.BinA364]